MRDVVFPRRELALDRRWFRARRTSIECLFTILNGFVTARRSRIGLDELSLQLLNSQTLRGPESSGRESRSVSLFDSSVTSSGVKFARWRTRSLWAWRSIENSADFRSDIFLRSIFIYVYSIYDRQMSMTWFYILYFIQLYIFYRMAFELIFLIKE